MAAVVHPGPGRSFGGEHFSHRGGWSSETAADSPSQSVSPPPPSVAV